MARRFELGPYDPRGGRGGGGRRGPGTGPPMMYHDSLPRRFHQNQRVSQQELHQQVRSSLLKAVKTGLID